MREQDLAGSLGGRFLPRICERSSGEPDSSSARSDLNRTISLSLCTSTPATSCARSSRSPKRKLVLATLVASKADFGLPSLHPKIPFPAAGVQRPNRSGVREYRSFLEVKNAVRKTGRNYSGFNPSVSNCRLHSDGASRNRSTPMPRGSRPSTAALTRSGARKASDMVMLTWRTLHFCRVAIC